MLTWMAQRVYICATWSRHLLSLALVSTPVLTFINSSTNMSISTATAEVENYLPKQPDITYHPDRQKWESRTRRRLEAEPSLPFTPLPAGFPKKLVSPLVWEGKDWTSEGQWVYNLTSTHLDEINAAIKHFHSTCLISFLSVDLVRYYRSECTFRTHFAYQFPFAYTGTHITRFSTRIA